MLTLVALLLVGGSLGDQFGRRRIFVIGLIAFGATSALCAVAPSVEFLIGARALQGVAGALLVPGSLAIVAASLRGCGARQGGRHLDRLDRDRDRDRPGRGRGADRAHLLAGDLLGQPAADRGDRGAHTALGAREPRPRRLPGHRLDRDRALRRRPRRSRLRPDRAADARLGRPAGLGAASSPASPASASSSSTRPVPATRCSTSASSASATSAVANLTTLTAYAGLIGGLFFVGLYLQQVAGYSALEAGLATTPVSLDPLLPLAALGPARLRHRAATADDARPDRRRASAC